MFTKELQALSCETCETKKGGILRGGINYQINRIFIESGIFTPGQSKHEAKEHFRENGASTWSELGKELNIYSYRTAEVYKQVWHNFANWAKENMNLRDIEKVNSEHVRGYLQSRIEVNVKYSTFERECAALAKLERALNMYSEKFQRHNEYTFRNEIYSTKQEAANVLDRSFDVRAYNDPKAIINNIENEQYRLVASVQYEGGARVNEVYQIKIQDLKGIKEDKYTNETRGYVEVTGKGGKEREIAVSVSTYDQLKEYLSKHENMHFDKNEYRESLKEACARCGEEYHGSHGFRWNFAEERMCELAEKTELNYEERMQIVAWEMGHERADITERYLKR